MKLQPASEHPHGLTDADFDILFTKDKPIIFAFHGYPWLIHRLTYRRTNHHNLHVRGYKEEGTTTTPFDMVVLNDLDRFQLAEDVINRLPQLGARAAYFKQAIHDKLIDHKQYIAEHGDDMPEISGWCWGRSAALLGVRVDPYPVHELAIGPGPITTSQLKRPWVWIAGRDVQEPPLQVGTSHPLRIQMRGPNRREMIRSELVEGPIEDIPEGGLYTVWVLSSEDVALELHPDDLEVKASVATYDESDHVGSGRRPDRGDQALTIWSARFELLIPRVGDSTERVVAIRPTTASRARIDFLIYLWNDARHTGPDELYRWFHVDLPLSSRPGRGADDV
jgi:hypothetical protein